MQRTTYRYRVNLAKFNQQTTITQRNKMIKCSIQNGIAKRRNQSNTVTSIINKHNLWHYRCEDEQSNTQSTQERVEKVKQKVYKMVILLYYYDYYYYSLFKKTLINIEMTKREGNQTLHTMSNCSQPSGCCLLFWVKNRTIVNQQTFVRRVRDCCSGCLREGNPSPSGRAEDFGKR